MNDGDRDIKLDPSWKSRVGDWFAREDMQALSRFLRERKAAGARIFPPGPQIFSAFDATPFEQVKVVILGQDPYHGYGQAHGLCFSVQPGVTVPPSLDNIFKEIHRDLGIARPDHGCLLPWAKRGVLLLNAVLTVEEGRAGAHQGKGWEGFTDHAVDVLNREREGLVFLLWGSYAQAKGKVIDPRRHRRCRRTAASSAAAISPPPTNTSRARGRRRSTGPCRRAARCSGLAGRATGPRPQRFRWFRPAADVAAGRARAWAQPGAEPRHPRRMWLQGTAESLRMKKNGSDKSEILRGDATAANVI